MKKPIKTKKKVKTAINSQDLVYKYKLFSDLMEHTPDVIYFKDNKGRILMVNKAYTKGLKTTVKKVIGKTDFDFFSKKRAEVMAKDDEQVLKDGKLIIDKIERATRHDGIDNYVSTTKVPRYDDKGKIVGLIGITRDITRRMHLEQVWKEKVRIEKKVEMLEGMNRLKSEFISSVSHELRTPLAIIKQLVSLIYDGTVGEINSKQKEILMKTGNNIKRLKKIIDEVLDISRIERGALKFNYTLINLNDLIEESADFFKGIAKDRGIDLSYKVPNKQVNIFIDCDRVNQIIFNLIDNAIKFTEDQGKIRIEIKILETKVRIGVIDTGIGVTKAGMNELFNKFVQVSQKASAEKKGIGLGLSLVKELVERHGGEIWVESKLGVGSKFYFTLPRFYKLDILDNNIKDQINNLLDKGKTIYFISVLIINYREFKFRTKVKSKKLFNDLEDIIDQVFSEVCKFKGKKPQIVKMDTVNGQCNIIFPNATEEKAIIVSEMVKDRIKNYFSEHQVKNIFVTVGIMPYPTPDESLTTKRLPANIHIKEMYIGSKIRRFKRISYEPNVDIILSKDEIEPSKAVDISRGGICLVTKISLAVDSEVDIKFELPRNRQFIQTKARVAWVKNLDRCPKEKFDRNKIGLEFIKLKTKIPQIFLKELKL
ncbi:MAG: ATP-binding protein [Candidatus Susulua stagnicola]|nr:ATP-binding protein [Candidatus Susulua stagnicola]